MFCSTQSHVGRDEVIVRGESVSPKDGPPSTTLTVLVRLSLKLVLQSRTSRICRNGGQLVDLHLGAADSYGPFLQDSSTLIQPLIKNQNKDLEQAFATIYSLHHASASLLRACLSDVDCGCR